MCHFFFLLVSVCFSKLSLTFFSRVFFLVLFQACNFFFPPPSFVSTWQLWVDLNFLLFFIHLGWFAIVPWRMSGQWQTACPTQPCASIGSPALLLCPLDYQSAWKVFFHFTSSQWLAAFVTHTFHKVSVLYFIAFEANKSELTCYHKLWVLLLAQIPFFLSRNSTGDLT